MTSAHGPAHVVVDGSNIATEGRSLPSLAQLSEAVMAFMEDHPDTAITVVVDATFGHRIDKKEVKEFEAGISNNELVAPPAGAVGRGDAFVLAIADKSDASILSNDSFQEFHADYKWLFDEGRLIGGKPVPHVGWVFVDRSPVRGPVSRKVTNGSKKSSSRRGSKKDSDQTSSRGHKTSAAANEPMPVPTAPPPGRSSKPDDTSKEAPKASTKDTSKDTSRDKATVSDDSVEHDEKTKRSSVPRAGEIVNELMPFLEFVEHHPIGTSVNGTVDSYSSHGAYVSVGTHGVRAYVPLRLMADPAPTSARKVMRVGESVTLVVVNFAPARRSIDCAVPDLADAAIAAAKDEPDDDSEASMDDVVSEAAASETEPVKKAPAKKAAAKKAPAKKAAAKKAPAKKAAAKKAPVKKAPAKKAAVKKAPAEKTAAKKTPAKKAPAKATAPEMDLAEAAPDATSAEKAVVKKTAARKTAAKKVPAEKIAVKKAPAAARKAPAAKAVTAKGPARKVTAAKKTPAKQTPTKKAAATKATATKVAAKKAPAKKVVPVAKVAAKRAPAKKVAAKKAPAKKTAAKKAPAKKTTAKNAAVEKG